MTLRTRLLLLTLSMVAAVALVMTAVNLNSLAASALEVAVSSAEMSGRQLKSFLQHRLEDVTPARVRSVDETKALWKRTVLEDADLTALLEQTMAQSRAIVEISVSDEEGWILASSSPARRGGLMLPKTELRALRDAGLWKRTAAILTGRDDYETRVPLGIPGQKKPLFTVQVLVSSVFLRDAVMPELRSVGIASGIALLLAVLLAYWSSVLALRPLRQVGELIDEIAEGGEMPAGAVRPGSELSIIETKLHLLGEQFRDAREDATRLRGNLEGALAKLDAGSRQQVEDQLAVAQRLSAIGKLTGRVAHEIKNPLNSIALRLEMLRARLSEESEESAEEFQVLSEEVTRLDRVVRTFLDFNRPVELAPVEVDLNAEVQEIAAFLGPEAELRQVTLEVSVPPEPVLVRMDRDLLRQALLNIAMNGVEAMDSGGTLRLQVERATGLQRIRISDNGPGIPPDLRARIFDLYFTTKKSGSGIGLAMAFRAAQLHGGTIEVDSELGQGTTFTMTLPGAV